LNRVFDVVIIDEAAQAVRVSLISFGQYSHFLYMFVVMGFLMSSDVAG